MDPSYDVDGVVACVFFISAGSGLDDEERTEIVLSMKPPAEAEIGDLIVEQDMAGYRTDGVFIVDHERNIVDLSDYPDDYGSLPEEFRPWTFINPRTGKRVNVDYWHNAFDESQGGTGWHSISFLFDSTDFNITFIESDIFSYEDRPTVKLDMRDGKIYYIQGQEEQSNEEFLEKINEGGYISTLGDLNDEEIYFELL